MERLQKIIANSGYCSRRKAEELILNGKVKVNGEVINTLGSKASYADTIIINGVTLKLEPKEYVLLYKPRGVVSSVHTSGLLLLTNDGELTNLLIHPSHEVEKVYLVKIDDIVNPSLVKSLSNGVVIDGKKTGKARVKIKKIDKKKKSSLIELTIYEGRNHQVKKMFEAIGYKVSKLKREKFAGLTLDGLKSGEYRHLNIKEVKTLYAVAKN